MSQSVSQTFPLPSNLDLDAIDSIRDWLLPALDQGPVVLDGGQVERVYTNCLLMLMSAASESVAHGHKLVIDNASPAFSDAVASLGLTPHFSEILGA